MRLTQVFEHALATPLRLASLHPPAALAERDTVLQMLSSTVHLLQLATGACGH